MENPHTDIGLSAAPDDVRGADLLDRCYRTLLEASARSGRASAAELLDFVALKTCYVFGAVACVIWKADEKRQTLGVVAASRTVDAEFRALELTRAHRYLDHLQGGQVGYLA